MGFLKEMAFPPLFSVILSTDTNTDTNKTLHNGIQENNKKIGVLVNPYYVRTYKNSQMGDTGFEPVTSTV